MTDDFPDPIDPSDMLEPDDELAPDLAGDDIDFEVASDIDGFDEFDEFDEFGGRLEIDGVGVDGGDLLVEPLWEFADPDELRRHLAPVAEVTVELGDPFARLERVVAAFDSAPLPIDLSALGGREPIDWWQRDQS